MHQSQALIATGKLVLSSTANVVRSDLAPDLHRGAAVDPLTDFHPGTAKGPGGMPGPFLLIDDRCGQFRSCRDVDRIPEQENT
jgi:hypothetical protein